MVVRAARPSRLDTWAWRLFVAGLLVLFCFSEYRLISLGYPYEAPLLGPFPFKIHPGTYLVTLSLVCALAARGHPLRAALGWARREPLLTLHLSAMVTCLLWVLYRHGSSGAAFIVDTHWLPALAAFALLQFDDRRRAFLFRLLAVLILANALIAMVEVATQSRLTPVYIAGQAERGAGLEEHFRASALRGHPLSNAKIAASLLPMALLLPMRGLWRWLHVGIVALSVLAFGGRAALGVSLAVYGSMALWTLASRVVRGRYSYLQLTGGSVLLLMALSGAAGFVIASGLGERIFDNLYLDNSASVRLRVWQAYDYLTQEQLWFGISARDIDQVALRLGLDPQYEAIENGWIYLSMQFGLVVFALWLVGFLSLLAWALREAAPLARAGVIVFVLVASTSNSFASKTVNVCLIVLFAATSGAQLRRNRLVASLKAQAGTPVGRKNLHAGPPVQPRMHPARAAAGIGLPVDPPSAPWEPRARTT